MPIIRHGALIVTAFTLANCGGSSGTSSGNAGNNSGPPPALQFAAGSETLATLESNDNGTTTTPVDDTTDNVPGYLVSEGNLDGEAVESSTSAITAGRVTTVTIDGQVYSIANGSSTSDDGSLSFVNNSVRSNDYSALSTVTIDGNAAAYVRGVVTPLADLPTTSVNYQGDATLTVSGQSTAETGQFDMSANFGAGTLTGNVNVGSLDGEIAGQFTDGAASGEITGSGLSDMDFVGNVFGPNADEFTGAASGQFEGSDAVIGLTGSR